MDAAPLLGADLDHDGRAVAPIDVDGDGDLDLALLSLQDVQVLLNTSAPRRWIRVSLRATRTEPHALGARVIVRAGGRAQLDRVRLTAGFHTQVSTELHFGLADATRADLEVRWPSGRVEHHRGLAADARYVLTEGDAVAHPRPLPRWPDSVAPKTGLRFDPRVAVHTLEGAQTPLVDTPTPTLVNFWAPWCAGCEQELPDLARLHREGGARVVGVSAETKDLDGVRAFVARHGASYPQRLATDEAVAAFFGAGGRMTLPATFLMDAGGQLRRSWYRRIDPAEVGAAVAALETRPAPVDHITFAGRMQREGDHVKALALTREAAAAEPSSTFARYNLGLAALGAGELDLAERTLRQIVERQRAHPKAWLALARVARRQGHSETARQRAEEGLRHARINADREALRAELQKLRRPPD